MALTGASFAGPTLLEQLVVSTDAVALFDSPSFHVAKHACLMNSFMAGTTSWRRMAAPTPLRTVEPLPFVGSV